MFPDKSKRKPLLGAMLEKKAIELFLVHARERCD